MGFQLQNRDVAKQDAFTASRESTQPQNEESGITAPQINESQPMTSDDPSAVTYVRFVLARDGSPTLEDGTVYDPRVAYRSVLYVLSHIDWSKLAPDAESAFKVKVQKLFGLSTNSLVLSKEELADLAGRTAEAIMKDDSLDKKRALSERQKFGTKTPEFLSAINSSPKDDESSADDDDDDDGESNE